MDRRRAVLLVVRAIALVALIAVVRADGEPTDVLGSHDERANVVAHSRSRRAHAMLRAFGLEPGDPIEDSSSYVELTASIDTRGTMLVKERTIGSGRLPVLRTIGSADDQFLVVALDEQRRVRYSATVADPTRIRAEFPDESGRLQGQIVERDAEIDVRVPNDERIVSARVYRADGSKTLLASFEVR
jgi:hypothetical protein